MEPDKEVLHIIRVSFKGIRRCKAWTPNPDQTRLEIGIYDTALHIGVCALHCAHCCRDNTWPIDQPRIELISF
jgi:hypothetical protein